jgi:putative transposase
VSRICTDIDVQVQAFANRPLEECGYAYIYLETTYLHGRFGKALQVCTKAVVAAMGVNADGRRELFGIKGGDSEGEGFWSEFLASLKERGFIGVKLVISDAHMGLTDAIRRQLQGCAWQRCRVRIALKLLQRVPKAHQGMVTGALRSVFAQEDASKSERCWVAWPLRQPNASTGPPNSCWRPRRSCWRSAISPNLTGTRSGAPA